MGLQFVLEVRLTLDEQRFLARRFLVWSRLLMMRVMTSGSFRFLRPIFRPRVQRGRGDRYRGGLQPVNVVLGRRFRVRPFLQGSRGTMRVRF